MNNKKIVEKFRKMLSNSNGSSTFSDDADGGFRDIILERFSEALIDQRQEIKEMIEGMRDDTISSLPLGVNHPARVRNQAFGEIIKTL